MKIIFIRHAQSAANALVWPEGKDDPQVPITEKGENQAKECGEELCNKFPGAIGTAKIYVSPYVRAQQTFKIIKEVVAEKAGTNLVPFTDFRLREIYLTDEYKSHEEIKSFFKHKYSDRFTSKYEFMHKFILGAESCSKLIDRTYSLLDGLKLKNGDNTVILIGHSISYAAMRAICEGENVPDIDIYERFRCWATDGRIRNCQIVEFEY